MTDVIKMDYGLMEEMSKTFDQGAEQLNETLSEVQSLAQALEDGALLGRSGDAFADAIKSQLCKAIARLEEKFKELSRDIQKAAQDMKKEDAFSERQF